LVDRAYLSIGEVLSLLKEEFPDITISKIRFLESQGLLDPERTPSGYRKFYDADVDRLRWILRQQREHFLPLKVIKGRLQGTEEPGADTNGQTELPALIEADALAGLGAEPELELEPVVAPPDPVDPNATSFTIDEIAELTEVDVPALRELERFGLLVGQRPVGGIVYYDRTALVIARLAGGFMKFGVEARHLRMYKTAAERESAFFEQLVMPMLKQRNPEARRQAGDTIAELTKLGAGLRAAMLQQALDTDLATR
jgi:DNA-binding transcriptional MerR regulator